MIDKDFFAKYQKILIWLFNTKLGKWYFKIRPKGKIVAVFPNAIRWVNPNSSYTTEFRTNNRFAYRVNTFLKYFPFFRWEKSYNWYPQLNLGLTVTTVNPDPDPESTSVDGRVADISNNATWATIIAAAGDNALPSNAEAIFIGYNEFTSGTNWADLFRSIFLFDTSSIGDTDSIDSAILSLRGTSKADATSTTPNINIYSSAPTSNTDLVGGDFDSLGSTAFSTAITYANFSTTGYNDFTLNTDGLNNITATGVSKFGARNANYDVAAVDPGSLGNGSGSSLTGYYADQTGTADDPKLAVTHTAPAPLLETNDPGPTISGVDDQKPTVSGITDSKPTGNIDEAKPTWGF